MGIWWVLVNAGGYLVSAGGHLVGVWCVSGVYLVGIWWMLVGTWCGIDWCWWADGLVGT